MPKSTWTKLLNTAQITKDFSETPYGLEWRSNTFFIIATVAVGLFCDLFLYGLVVLILPFMLQDRIGLPKDQIQGHVSGLLAAYAASSVVFSPLAGIISDKISTRQGPFLGGLAALLSATILLFIGQNLATLYVARILQGLSAAVVWSIGLTLCLETVGPENLGKTIGTVISFASVGSLAAPAIGGVLYEKSGYTGVFGVGFAVLAVDFIMRVMVIEKKVARKYPGGAKLVDGPPEDGQNDDAQNQDEDANESQPLLSKSPSQEDEKSFKLSKDQPRLARSLPILPCLSHPRLLSALLVALIQATLLGAFDSTITTEAQELFNFTSLESGLLFIPLGIFDLILGPVFGWAVDKYGTKPVAVGAYSWLTIALTLLRLPQAGGKDQIILYSCLLSLCGVGLAAVGAPSIVEAGAVVQKYYEVNPDFFGEEGPYAQLYGLNSMVFSAGLALGPSLAGGLKSAIGYGNMNAVLAGICGATAVVCFLFIGGWPRVLSKGRD
ncbi:hypothetical protein B0A48_09757 [Cryoendolithus antarcticus]|uniref:Major facilitator superfamily (MFS) profile domain-containing protein n=1 Tax=Cryoendolithus antarcticus TaxID=1507870 RepID=A0A1V8T2M1_9PEZI|nr:hypothetical protein B0A48_09757 [Cryoendolithus antarcticus]